MKKKQLRKLKINKNTISKLSAQKVTGGAMNSGPCTSSVVHDHCVLACHTMEAC